MVFLRWVAAAAVLLAGLGVRAEAQRLPGGVRPEHYSLVITPDLAKATFAGSERIEVVLDAPAKTITLNAAEIQFGAVKAWVGGVAQPNTGVLRSAQNDNPRGPDHRSGSEGQAAVVTLDGTKEQATFTFAQELPAGPVTLAIDYTGILNDKLRGFYLSKSKMRNYGVTQFEATDARRAFPSFDEPALKATFDVSLVVDAGDTAISNMNMVSDKPGPVAGKHTLAFATTPKMSTYLVAWLVGDFVCTKGKSDGIPIRSCSTPERVKTTRFALEAARWDLHYYDRYFGIKYPLPKLDMVAIPDFDAGAMENFGCITYRETEMLVDEKNSTLAARKDVATTVAHEIAHQWFGDLVTPDWWDNIWLNEGFATWMETKAAAAWRPKWEYPQDVAVDKNHTMDVDAERITRAIQAKAETPAEINELFDDIAYGKAGSVIGMVEHWVGEDVFQRGVQAYLQAHLYGNATAEDFWTAQTKVSGQPVDKVMRSFVEQPGVPEVILPASGQVTQQRFSVSGPDAVATEAWTIPVCFTGSQCRVLSPAAGMDVPGGSPFLFANAADKGYYRTSYTPDRMAGVVAHLETSLTAPERIGLIGDQWALMRGGQETVGEFLNLALAVKQDQDATVIDTALGRVQAIASLVATDEDRERLNAVVRRELAPVYAAMGGAKRHESYDHAELRETLFEALGHAGDPAVLAEAKSLTDQLFLGKKPADPMLGDAAVALAAPGGDAAMYDHLQRVAGKTEDPDFRQAALHVLTRFQTPALVERTLEYALSSEVRSQDSWMLIALLLEQRETQDQAWAFVEQHWPEIERKKTETSDARIVEAAGAFCTVEKRDEVASFFAAHPPEASARTLAKSIDMINDCIRLRAAQQPELRRWLDLESGSKAD